MKRCVPFLVILVYILIGLGVSQQNSESDDFSYALKLFNEQFYELAAKQFSRFVYNYPLSSKVPEARYYSGLSLYQLEDYENARIEFQGVAVDFPSSTRAAESWFMVGECYLKLNNEPEAAKAFEMVKNLYPQHIATAKSILRAGELYQKFGSLDKAEQLYNLIQTRYVETAEYFPALLAHGSLYMQKGENSKAEEKLKKVLDSESGKELKSKALYLLGEMYRTQGYFNNAIKYFQQVINTYSDTPIYPEAVLSLSQIHLQQGDFAATQNIISQVLQKDLPPSLAGQLEEKLADSHFLRGQYGLALKFYQQSTEKNDSARFVIRKIKSAISWKNQNNLAKAAESLQEIVLNISNFNKPGYKEAKDLYFQWLLQIKDYDQGLIDLYRLKSTSKLDKSDRDYLVSFYRAQGDWLGIIKELEASIYSQDKFPAKDNYIYQVGLAQENLDQYEESGRYYAKLINEYASSELVDSAQIRLRYLEDYKLVDQNFGISQLALIIGSLINQQDRGKLQFQLGKIYFENLKDYSNALIQFENALLSPESDSIKTDIHYYLGLTYERLADHENTSNEKAQLYLEKAKENLSLAMENINSAVQPDLVAWNFVRLGIRVENSPVDKQIGYYKALIDTYTSSKYREFWHAELARLYEQDEANWDQALNQYNILSQIASSSSHYPDYIYSRAKLKEIMNQNDAVEDYRRIAGAFPNSRAAARALYNLGLTLERTDNYADAIQIFNKLRNDYFYTDVAQEATALIGDTYLYAGEDDLAVSIYVKQLSSLPTDDVVLNKEFVTDQQKGILFKLGRAYFKQGQLNKSRECTANYLLSDPMGPYRNAANYLLGEVYLALNDPKSAVVSLSNITSDNSELYKQALRKMADTYFAMGEYNSAAERYSELAKLVVDNPAEKEIQAQVTISLIRSGTIKQAENSIAQFSSKFKSADEYLASFQFELGDYYRQNQNYNNAVKYFNRITSKYGKTSYVDNAEYYLALTYLSLNKQNEALSLLTNFPKKYPNSENVGAVLNTLGSIYFRSEKYESAITSFRNAMDKPLTPLHRQQVMSNLIKAYSFVNFWDAALGLAREYIESYPYAEDIIDKKILMSRAYVALNQVDKAVELLKETRLIADSEREPEIQFYIGDAYFRSGQYENAIAEYVKIPLLSRKTKLQWEASALYYSGQAYEKLGRIDEAVRMYEEIVKRPGIDLVLKKDAQKRISQIKN